MLPLHLFRSRGFTAANAASLLMYFGMFGSIFLLVAVLPGRAGLEPVRGRPARPAVDGDAASSSRPIAGVLSGRIGARPIVVSGPGADVARPGLDGGDRSRRPPPYSAFVLPFIVSGIGMGMFFAPIANVVLSAVRPEEEGKASGANNAIREVGGVFGVAVLAAVFTANGSYSTPQAYVDGLVPAVWLGAAVVAVSAVVALFIPNRVVGQVMDAEGDVYGESATGEFARVVAD